MTLSFALDRHQSRAFRMVQPGRTCTFPFGRGSGKTFLARALVHALALAKPNQQIGILYPSLIQARKVIWMGPTGLLVDCARLMRVGQVRRYHRSELTIEYANGSQVTTWGAENAGGILGQRFSALLEDETDDIDPEVERAVVQPTFSKAGLDAIWVKFGTPRRGRHGSLYASFHSAEQETKGFRITDDGATIYAPELPQTQFGFRLRSADSPQVDQKWLSKVRGELYSKGKGPTYEREYECNFDASEGLVYPTFNQDFHVCEPDYGVPWTEILVGVDHGWNDPGVFLPQGVIGNGRDAITHLLEEVYETAKDTTWWGDKAAEMAWRYRNYRQRWYADPSRPDRIVDIRRRVLEVHPELRGSFTIEPAENSIEAGVDAVADRLAIRDSADGTKRSRLYISPSCANTLTEFGKYRRKRDPKNIETILDDIVDKDNHAMDSLRYPLFTRFGGPDGRRHECGPVSASEQYPEPA